MMEQEKVIRVRPVRGGWRKLYKKMERNPWLEEEISLIVTPEMYKNPPSIPKGKTAEDMKEVITFDAQYSCGHVYISSLVRRNYCDEDGYGMEPDEYLSASVSKEGIFLSLLC